MVVNVPNPRSTNSQILMRKLYLVALCVIAPEIIFQAVLGQWLSSHRSVKLFCEAGHPDWNMRHGFYADMGGFHLQCPDWKSFPVDAKQLHYLVVHKYVEYPQLQDSHIQDKNKVDGMLRLITFIQALWFIANVIGRASQGLAITVLELSTSAFVIFSVATAICWMRKPADVQQPDYIITDKKITEILLEAGEPAAGVYYNTPLDFVSRREWWWTILWAHGLNYLRKLHIAAPPRKRPIGRFENTVFPCIGTLPYLLFVVLSLDYLGVFVAGWNFRFATRRESVLWRAATLTALSSALGVAIFVASCFHWHSVLRRKLRSRSTSFEEAGKEQPSITSGPAAIRKGRSRISTIAAYLKNNSVLKDPALDAPVEAILVTWFLGFFYISARAYIIVADFWALRSLPRSAYQDVSWSAIWPHI
ncbi:hypothetical protein EPUS_05202 [Endocarpon pusillum Z07020]|uniref:Uncharacterized protein n=1 Tax=Endocarpon pusillum (strain Z07020 / HMAS-L-300199) TaxID=1263415 RepID=U1GE69_ENDPU|nr:uncharacterized protein EPUS_05202 [Endocarpon pusillum Z07020]ERF70383.1 hypothetical protein EPUS_05202 [Endocarpon pusillum Z07020]